MTRTGAALAQAGRPLRRLNRTLSGLAPLAALASVLAAAAWTIRTGLVSAPILVLVAWVLGVGAALLVLLQILRARSRFSPPGVARELERRGFRAGALRSLLDAPAAGTSPGLRDSADRQAALSVAASARGALGPVVARLVRLVAATSGVLLVAVLLLGAAGFRSGRAALLWQPREALALVSSPLRIAADRRSVGAGDSVSLTISAPGRQQVWLWTRSPGTTWEREPVPLDSAGRARRTAGPLRETLFAHVTAGARSSDTISVAVRRPAFLAALVLTLHYPSYLGLESAPLLPGPDTLLIPAGSRIALEGEATVPLRSAAWSGASGTSPLRVRGTRIEGDLRPVRSGLHRLALTTGEGEELPAPEAGLTLRVMPDLPPVLEIPVPAGDTTAPASGTIPVVVDARDDHGLAEVAVEQRLTRAGRERRLADQILPLPGAGVDRAILPAAVDPAGLGLQPGDTLVVVARARDRSPAGQVGRSREVRITVPTRPQLRAEGRDRTADLARQLDSLVAESREAQREAEDLSRQQQRERQSGADRGTQPGRDLDFEAARKAQSVADRQQELLRQGEEARRSIDELRSNAERAGLADSVFLERLREVQQELERALSPELRERLAELQEALRELDRERTRSAVQNLSEAQDQLREALERSRELFKRAALEGELASLEQESRDLAAEQQRWNAALGAADSSRASRDEQALARRADSVAAGLDEAARRLEAEARREALNRAADTARAAAGEMRRAAQAAAQSRTSEARRSGERAAGQMGQVRDQVQEQREGQQEEWREEIVAQLDRALLETARLAERQLGIAEQFRRGTGGASARNAQGAAEEAAQKLLDQVTAASGKNALVSPQIVAAFAEARRQMRLAREAAASVSANQREAAQSAGEAVDALNVAAYGLLRSREAVSGASSGSGLAEAMERMTQLANRQGQLSQDASGLLPLMGSAAAQQQLEALAARQRELARALERLRAEGQIDARPLGDEAGELARQLERGRLDRDVVSRQERLFRRMLDAGRTLQGHEEDQQKERQGEAARLGQVLLPPALRDRLLRETIRLPGWDELQRLSPEERRLVTEYFRRLSGGSP